MQQAHSLQNPSVRFVCPVQTSALGVVYPCLLLIYLGQAAFLTQNTSSFSSLYYSSIPAPIYWPMFVLALLASIVASQSIITGAAPQVLTSSTYRPVDEKVACCKGCVPSVCHPCKPVKLPVPVHSKHARVSHEKEAAIRKPPAHYVQPHARYFDLRRLLCRSQVPRSQTPHSLHAGTFSIIAQSMTLNCFPRVRIVHTSTKVCGQIYIPEINWCLMTLGVALILGFTLTQPDSSPVNTAELGNAFGKICSPCTACGLPPDTSGHELSVLNLSSRC